MLALTTLTFNPLEENTFLVYNEKKECCIIDPGCYFPEERDRLKTAILQTGLTPVLLLNTHCHLDHVFGNQFVHDTWGLRPHIHTREKPVLERAAEAGQKWGLPFDNYTGEVIYVEEKEKIRLGEDEMEVIFSPGHSPGSISFYYEPGRWVIGGDVLFNGSIGRTDLPGGDFDTLFNTIQTKFFTLPDDTKIYSGHGPVTTIGFEKMNNPFMKMY